MKRLLLCLVIVVVLATSLLPVGALPRNAAEEIFFDSLITEMPEREDLGNPPQQHTGLTDDRVMKGNWENIPIVDNSYLVHDFAGVLSPQERQELEERAQGMSKAYTMDVVVVITANTLGRDEIDFSRDFFEANAFGSGSKTSGIIFVLDYQHRKMHISTHGLAIRRISDDSIEQIFDGVSEVLGQDISRAYDASNAFMDRTNQLLSDNGTSSHVATLATGRLIPTISNSDLGIMGVTSAGIGLLGGLVVLGILRITHKASLPGAISGEHYVSQERFHMTVQSDQFMSTYTARRARPQSSSGGGGGGGGSSSSRSSSGSSFGGGSRSF